MNGFRTLIVKALVPVFFSFIEKTKTSDSEEKRLTPFVENA
tara:strand:- start:299 stop:421 length:123 start_codon:yes stop_codon:yes gene_type:complete